MGVLNVTPDSFSDGGRWSTRAAAVERGTALVAAGADIVDVGGESTRPGAARVPAEKELARVVPVVEQLAAAGVPVSVDTTRAEVAVACVEAGAVLVNDVSGGLADPAMHGCVAELGTAYVAMHWRAHSDRMDDFASYPAGVGAEVVDELAARRDAALAAGILRDRLVLDPGVGFAKTATQNWEVLAALPRLARLGQPLLVGASRKRFLGALPPHGSPGEPRPVERREAAGVAVTVLAASRGVWAVRVHEPEAHRDAIAVLGAWEAATGGPTDGP
ncbi:dihydropteroate synthase [Nocardioidaceae bacterium]|nr:dihydropteroate synthase [Nocardioidaceae bacterium]